MPKNDLRINENRWRHRCLGQGLQTRMLIIVPALTGLLTTGFVQAQIPAPQLSVDNTIATAGFFRLSWETDAESVELQEAASPDFRKTTTAYSGPDRATVISGKSDGTWHYRVRVSAHGEPGPWSDPVSITVAHHNLGRALIFLALGFIVFVAIVLTIVRSKETE